MEGFKITEFRKDLVDLDFDTEENIPNSYNIIKSEYRKRRVKQLKYLIPVVIVIVVYFTIIYPLYLAPDYDAGISSLQPYNFNLTINWTLFSIGIYLILYFIKEALMKVTPSLQEHLEKEINNIGFNLQTNNKSWIVFLILNGISVLLLLLVELNVIYFNTFVLRVIFRGFIIIYLTLSITIPLVWRFLYDRLTVKIKNKYKVFLYPYYKLQKRNVKDYQIIGIYLTSNRIASKFNKNKEGLFKKIAGMRWLPRKKKYTIYKYNLSPFLRFNEFSTPSNFQKQFLNIVLALQEWHTKTTS
ncbi:MAG: hypothetical protein ACFE91_05965 [Promethearchaeota archaeon]